MDNEFTKPITEEKLPENWKSIPIKECGEPLVELVNSDKIEIDMQYFKQGLAGSIDKCYLRQGVAARIKQAGRYLLNGYKFCILDGYRPIELQWTLYNQFKDRIKQQYPEMSEKEVEIETQKFITIPDCGDKNPSAHNGGASVDLTIINENGKELDMGTEFDNLTPKASTRYFEELKKSKTLTDEEKQIVMNRRLLFNILKKSGLSNYGEEWWHFGYGCQLTLGGLKEAIYGSVEGKPYLFPKIKTTNDINLEEHNR